MGLLENVETLLGLQPTFNADIGAFVISGVSLLVERRGSWLGTTESDTLTAASSPNPMDISLATAQDFNSPTQLKINFPHHDYGIQSPGFVVVSDVGPASVAMDVGSPGDLLGSLSGYPEFTKIAVGNNSYSSTNLIRFTSTGTGVADLRLPTSVGISGQQSTVVAAFIAVRNVNLTASFSIWHEDVIGGETIRGETVYIDKSSSDPQVVCLGLYPTGGRAFSFLDLFVQADVSGGQLEIDYIFCVALNDASSIIYLDGGDTSAGPGGCQLVPEGPIFRNWYLWIDPYQLFAPEPGVYVTNECEQGIGSRFPKGYRGDAYLATRNDDFCMAILLPMGSFWRYTDDDAAGDPVHDFDVTSYTASRRNFTKVKPQ